MIKTKAIIRWLMIYNALTDVKASFGFVKYIKGVTSMRNPHSRYNPKSAAIKKEITPIKK